MSIPTASPIHFAAVGDVHGHMDAMVDLVAGWERRSGVELSFVLQVGDFEPHRDERDLATMAAPAKYRKLGDFAAFHSGARLFPWPVHFIGGNHEPYGYLDLIPEGAAVARDCHYLGRVGMVELGGLRVAGLSGIYREESFASRPSIGEIGVRSNKEYIGFTEAEIARLLDLGRVDVLLLHEWPSGIIAEGDASTFEERRRSMRFDGIGNEHVRMAIDLLEPSLVLCGHMHMAYRSTILHPSGRRTSVCCLGSVEERVGALAIFRVATDGPVEIASS